MTDQNTTQATPVTQWYNLYQKKKAVTYIKLPSEMTVGVKQADPMEILGSGEIPNQLLPFFTAMMKRGTAEPSKTVEQIIEQGDLSKVKQLYDILVKGVLVEPAIVETEAEFQDGKGVLLDAIPFTDKQVIASWALGGEAAINRLKRFQQRQEKAVPDAGTGREV